MAPKNSVFTPFFEENSAFRYFIGQNWSLFAPPPKDNKKLYYTFYRKNSTETRTFEVLESLLKLKISNAPFNSSESVRDFILSNSASNVIWWSENYFKVEHEKSDEHFSEEEALTQKTEFIESAYHFQMLKSYAVLVAKEHNISLDDYDFSFRLAKIDIPDYEDRKKLMDEEYVFEEHPVFESEKFSLEP
ncbi:MAG TPA: hypothetical protein VFM82_10120 [Flavobacteriaceae bacterium]|nr:hypothetical protein [Flavobacteriaceae bacterium]